MPVNPLDRYRTDGLASQSPQRLLVLLYQRLGTDLARAEDALLDADLAVAHDALVHAQEIVTELRLALDTEAWPDGGALAELYRWLEQRLVAANITKSPVVVGECRELVEPLIDAWDGAYRAVQSGRREALGQAMA